MLFAAPNYPISRPAEKTGQWQASYGMDGCREIGQSMDARGEEEGRRGGEGKWNSRCPPPAGHFQIFMGSTDRSRCQDAAAPAAGGGKHGGTAAVAAAHLPGRRPAAMPSMQSGRCSRREWVLRSKKIVDSRIDC